MAIVTTVGSADTNSYIDIATADAYIATRFDCDTGSDSTWNPLDAESKEMRLVTAASLLAALPFMGIRSCVRQALAWPRLFPRDVLSGKGLYDTKGKFETFADVQDAAVTWEVDEPDIPIVVGQAQIEIAYQVVHKSLLSIEPLASANAEVSQDIESLSVSGAFKVEFTTSSDIEEAVASFLGGKPLTSLSIIQALLTPYLSRVRWRVV